MNWNFYIEFYLMWCICCNNYRLYEDRLDLLTVMICGPDRTPYEDGLFLIDMQLSSDYPKSPPSCYYISYCTDRLNPNLYEDGKVCVSLLGTWSGKDTELWGPNSTLLQVIVSIQGLILVPEPYFNEAGYEKQRGKIETAIPNNVYSTLFRIYFVLFLKVYGKRMKILGCIMKWPLLNSSNQ